MHRLGGLPIMLRPDELQLGRGEPIADTARVMSSYCAAIVIRTFAQRDVEEMAGRRDACPVINALTDDHHPCQALADLLTLRERFGDLAGLPVAYVGDGNNVAHSLIEAARADRHRPAARLPATATGPTPDDRARGRRTRARPRTRARRSPAPTPSTPTSGSRWASEAERQRRLADLEPLPGRRRALMALARRDAVFLHCLPAHRGEEVAADVIDGPAAPCGSRPPTACRPSRRCSTPS